MSAFDTARDLRLPGVMLERAWLDTHQLSSRMKNMVKKALRDGYTEGGWNSKARQLAKKIAEAQNLMLVDRSPHGFYCPLRNMYSDEALQQVIELLEADRAIYLTNAAHYSAGYKDSIIVRYNTAIDSIRDGRHFSGRWISVYSTELCAQICAVFASQRSKDMMEAVETTCDMIDNGEAITITLSQ